MINQTEFLIRIVKDQDWLIDLLREARKLKLPDWYIAAGVVRNTIWNYLHDYPTFSNQNDVDLIYYDLSDINGRREKISENTIEEKCGKYDWEIINQARAHLFKNGSLTNKTQAKSSCDSIAYWSETPTCIGIRLEDDDSITICAPHSIDDLMNLVVRPVPKPYENLHLYRERMRNKKWDKIWPKLKITEV